MSPSHPYLAIDECTNVVYEIPHESLLHGPRHLDSIKSVSHIVVQNLVRNTHNHYLTFLCAESLQFILKREHQLYAGSQFDPFAGFTFEDILWRNGFAFLRGQNNTLIACMTVKVEVRSGTEGDIDDWQTVTTFFYPLNYEGQHHSRIVARCLQLGLRPAPVDGALRPSPAIVEGATPVELRTLHREAREFLLYTPMSSCYFRWDDERLEKYWSDLRTYKESFVPRLDSVNKRKVQDQYEQHVAAQRLLDSASSNPDLEVEICKNALEGARLIDSLTGVESIKRPRSVTDDPIQFFGEEGLMLDVQFTIVAMAVKSIFAETDVYDAARRYSALCQTSSFFHREAKRLGTQLILLAVEATERFVYDGRPFGPHRPNIARWSFTEFGVSPMALFQFHILHRKSDFVQHFFHWRLREETKHEETKAKRAEVLRHARARIESGKNTKHVFKRVVELRSLQEL